jgi:leucyl aminopeptidase
MTVPALRLSNASLSTVAADVLVVGVQKTDDGPRLATTDPTVASLQAVLSDIGVTGAVDELRRLPLDGVVAGSVALIGLGSGQPTAKDLRLAAGSATRQLKGISSVAIALPAETDEEIAAVLEGAAIGAYAFTAYRVDSLATTLLPASDVAVIVDSADAPLATRAHLIATAVHTVRDLVMTPPSDLYPESFAAEAKRLAEAAGVQVTILDEIALAEGGFGGILGVGAGSVRPPRLVKLDYSPAGATHHLALVGKGITFDTGGLSLKSPVSMVGMKYDMTGAASVLATVVAAAGLGLPVHLTGWLCIAENMPSGSATRPNDVLRIRGGKTVENLNSDAEGRLVMADGLVAASEENPDAIIDIATLTGAARVALGNRTVGVMGDDEFVARVIATATAVGESFWQMPLPSELRSLLNSDIADIANVKPGNTAGGMLIAGHFLREFVGSVGDGDEKRQIPWAHLDIAGPASNDGGGWGFTPAGPTGIAVRTLIAVAEDFSRK